MEENKITKSAESVKKIGKAGKKVSTFVSIFVANLFWIIPAVIVFLVVATVMALVKTVEDEINGFFDSLKNGNNAFVSSIAGSSDEEFYGGRIIYKDDSQANIEIDIGFKDYVCNILVNINKTENVSTKFQIPDKIDDTFNNSYITGCVVSIVNALTTPEVSYTSENYMQGIARLDHFGLTSEEKTTTNNAIKSYFIDNLANIFNYTNSDVIDSAINDALDVSRKTNLDFVSEKLFVKDLLLTEDNSNFKFPKLNYVAFIYMPNKDINFENASYVFYVDSETEVVDVQVIFSSQTEPIETGQADSTWANPTDGFIKTLDVETDISLPKFNSICTDSIEQAFLTEDNVSILDVAQYDYKNNSSIMTTIFTLNEQNVNYLPQDTCLYLTFNSNIAFAFGEASVVTE